MKSYKYSTKDRALRVARTLGCDGYHSHEVDGRKKFMPCKSHKIFLSKTKNIALFMFSGILNESIS